MSLDTVHDLFIHELRDLYDAERQVSKALPKMAKGASTPELKTAFESHLEETREHIARLEKVFEIADERVRGKKCEGMAGLIEEGKSMLEEDGADAVRDAALIGAAQKVEHYEIAAYGTLIALARQAGMTKAVSVLEKTLSEEKATDEKLTAIAEGPVAEAVDAEAAIDA
jgi:ferritin-like metal-binding protein YciE